MKSWVKLYTELNRDPKMAPLTWAQKGIWAALLALAGELDVRNGDGLETGQLYSVEDTAWSIRCDIKEFTETVEVLSRSVEGKARGLLYEQDGLLFVTNYGKRQARAREDPAQVAARQRRHRAKKRNPIFERDDWTCQYCGQKLPLGECSIDHVVPISQGGSDDRSNLVTACMLCNDKKGARTPEQAAMPLRHDPRIVTSLRHDSESESESDSEKIENQSQIQSQTRIVTERKPPNLRHPGLRPISDLISSLSVSDADSDPTPKRGPPQTAAARIEAAIQIRERVEGGKLSAREEAQMRDWGQTYGAGVLYEATLRTAFKKPRNFGAYMRKTLENACEHTRDPPP